MWERDQPKNMMWKFSNMGSISMKNMKWKYGTEYGIKIFK